MVNWTAEKDAQLLVGIFEFTEIKFSQPLLKHLADKIGDGCTPKAVSHRLNIMRQKGTAKAGPLTPSKSRTIGTPKHDTPKTPASGKKRGRPAKNLASESPKTGAKSLDQSALSGQKRGAGFREEDGEEEDFNFGHEEKKFKIEQFEGLDCEIDGLDNEYV